MTLLHVLTVLLVLAQSHLCICVTADCQVEQLYRIDGSIIQSHKWFGRKAYSGKMDCMYIIRASRPDYRIEITTLDFDLEYTEDCAADSLTIYSGNNHTGSVLGRFCGAKPWTVISDTNVVYLKFVTDRYVNKGGFLLRFKFVTIQERRNRISCPVNFLPCGNGNCYYKDWKCDGIQDCTNNGDEKFCSGGGSTTGLSCLSTQKACLDGSKCVWNAWWCDKIRDCPDNSDESNCGTTGGGSTGGGSTGGGSTGGGSTGGGSTGGGSTGGGSTGSCGQTPIQPDETRIVGGKEAIPHSWPWMCSLRFFGGHFCGGSIYNNRWIVTAAHCVEGRMTASQWQVDCGRHCKDCTESSLQRKGVIEVKRHPNYDSSRTNQDIAMMKLDSALSFTNQVQPVCLPTAVPSAGTFCFTTGWGNTQNSGSNSVLRQVAVPIVSNAVCNDASHYGGGITSYMICAGYEHGGKDACQGDSGGPLVCRASSTSPWYLQGITSFGEGCAVAKRPGVYTRVQQYTSWISQQALN